jgi:hypothetical protein
MIIIRTANKNAISTAAATKREVSYNDSIVD